MMIQKPGLYPWLDIKELGEKAMGEALMYNYARGEVYRINSTALDVIKLCDGERTIDEIAEKLAEIYEISLDVIKKDIREIIEKFAELEVVAEGKFQG